MKYEVSIQVTTTAGRTDTLRTFDEDPKFTLGGEAFAIDKTAESFVQRIKNELSGSSEWDLESTEARPRRA